MLILHIHTLVIGLIAAAALALMTKDNFIDVWSYVLFAAVLFCSILRLHPILLICASAVAGFVLYY